MNRLYFDHHVPRALAKAARGRGLDVLTCQEDGTSAVDDDVLLARATALERVLVTEDKHFKRIVAEALAAGTRFTGVVFIRGNSELFQVAESLELLARAEEPAKFQEGVIYVPL
ncbi:MAG: DUF5615 family PIN-like protein [Planctomycetota bacterium]